MKKNIRILAMVTVLAFVMIAGWLTYIQIYRGEELLTHPRNRRLQLAEEGIKRGGIFDRKGRVLAKSEAPGRPRQYPYGPVTAPVLGYVSPVFGRAGIEQGFNKELLGFYQVKWNRIFGGPSKPRTDRGYDLYLTLDAEIQKLAYGLLGNRRGGGGGPGTGYRPAAGGGQPAVI